MNNLPPINQLRAFEAIVHHGSVTAAAKALHLTQAAVSKQITQLEESLSCSLFIRNADGLQLTEMGTSYYRQIAQALDLIQQAGQALKPGENRQRIVLAVDGSLAATWLAPRLAHFLQQQPSIDIEVLVAKSLIDQSGKHPVAADMQIVYGQPPWPRYKADKLLDFEEFPVCSPDYASQLQSAQDLNQHTLIHEVDHTGWQRWLAANHMEDVNYRSGPVIHDSISCLSMALNSGGIAIGDPVTCADWLEQGRLIKPFEQVVTVKESFYLLIPELTFELPELQLFRQWLLSQFDN